jgi:hypothetical protein
MRFLAGSLLAACFTVALVAASASAEPKGKAHGYWKKKGPPRIDRPAPAIPEPTGALLFGAGLLAAAATTRRRQAR